MDEPLFGERKEKTTVVAYVVGAIVTVFVLFSLIVAIIFGVKTMKEHFVLAGVLLCNYFLLVIMYWWYSKGDIEYSPKYKFLLFFAILSVIVAGVAVNSYVWLPKPKLEIPCNGLYYVPDGTCITKEAITTCALQGNYCLSPYSWQCMFAGCNATTTTSSGLLFP